MTATMCSECYNFCCSWGLEVYYQTYIHMNIHVLLYVYITVCIYNRQYTNKTEWLPLSILTTTIAAAAAINLFTTNCIYSHIYVYIHIPMYAYCYIIVHYYQNTNQTTAAAADSNMIHNKCIYINIYIYTYKPAAAYIAATAAAAHIVAVDDSKQMHLYKHMYIYINHIYIYI